MYLSYLTEWWFDELNFSLSEDDYSECRKIFKDKLTELNRELFFKYRQEYLERKGIDKSIEEIKEEFYNLIKTP